MTPNGDRSFRRDTLLTHVGGTATDRHGAVSPPVYRASTILFPTVAEWEASRVHANRFNVLRYGQLGTPTTFALEEAIATLEGGHRAMLLPSGLAAATTVLLALLKTGDHLLMTDSAYQPTRHSARWFSRATASPRRSTIRASEPTSQSLMRPETRVVFRRIARIDHVRCAGPASHRERCARARRTGRDRQHLGDAVLPSRDAARGRRVDHRGHEIHRRALRRHARHHHHDRAAVRASCGRWSRSSGTASSPDNAFLALRGLRTLGVRLERHQTSALQVAEWLRGRPEVKQVLYPALPTDPGHAIWKRDFTGASGLFGVVLHPVPKPAVDAMLNSLRLFGMGASFGGFESLASPWTRHASAISPARPTIDSSGFTWASRILLTSSTISRRAWRS